jgi:hypothetical protein
VARVVWFAIMWSALSIAVRSSNSSEAIVAGCMTCGGAIPLPFREAMVCWVPTGFSVVLGDGLSTSLYTKSP